MSTVGSRSLQVALEAAKAGADIAARHYRASIEVQTKDDGSPVTEADIAAEHEIRDILSREFPDDGFLGEETGRSRPQARRTWIVDPIDGTRSFVRGYPFFSTQIALQEDGDLVLGVSAAPAFGDLAFAERGVGAWLNDQPLAVSSLDALGDSTISIGNVGRLAADDRWQAIGRLAQETARFRGYGDFYHYHLLASGRLEGVIESDVNIFDVAALAVIVREAGGAVSDLAGGAFTLESTDILATNGALHERLLTMLRDPNGQA
ncbi:MAG: inositol monophosphatase family protein [Pseudomonadota bacterium]